MGVSALDRIDVLIVVDAEGALSSGDLEGNVYLVDTNKYLGSWQEGQSQLHTVCQDGQLLTWSAASVDPGNDVSIAGFSGQMVSSNICVPQANPIAGNGAWNGQIKTQGIFASYSYTVTITMGSKQLAFDAFVKVV